MARILCVLGMIYVHVPDGISGTPLYSFGSDSFGFLLESFLVEGPGRASAALLSVISGFLVATSLQRKNSSVMRLYRNRFVSIIVPMVFWALVTCGVYYIVSQTRSTFLDDATTLLDKLNLIFFITRLPDGATMHLGFLRDLFVCVLLSPLLLFAVRRYAWVVMVSLAVFYVLDNDATTGLIILRPLVLFAFTLGLLIAVRQWPINAWDRYFPLFLLLGAVATALIMLEHGGAFDTLSNLFTRWHLDLSETVFYPLSRLFGSLAIWTLIPHLATASVSSSLVRCSPYLFVTFCSHYLMLTLLFYGLWQPIAGGRESSLFIVWVILAPGIALLIAVMLVKLTSTVAPPLSTLLTGGRVCPSDGNSATPSTIYQRGHAGILSIGGMLSRLGEATASCINRSFRELWIQSRRWLLGKR